MFIFDQKFCSLISNWMIVYLALYTYRYSWSARCFQDVHRLSIRKLISSTSWHSVFIPILVFRSFPRYCTLHPSSGGTSLLDIAALILQDGVVKGSCMDSRWIFRRFFPVLDLAHLATMLTTTQTSGLELLKSCLIPAHQLLLDSEELRHKEIVQ